MRFRWSKLVQTTNRIQFPSFITVEAFMQFYSSTKIEINVVTGKQNGKVDKGKSRIGNEEKVESERKKKKNAK